MRLVLGGTFIASGFLKLLQPILFSDAIRNFELIGDPWVAVAAVTLPWLELVSGLGVATRFRQIYRGSLLLLAVSLAVFIVAFAISWARGLEIRCGCFGGEEVTNYPLAILRNLGLIALAGVLWWRETRLEPA
jgi:putative oxidoreductase